MIYGGTYVRNQKPLEQRLLLTALVLRLRTVTLWALLAKMEPEKQQH